MQNTITFSQMFEGKINKMDEGQLFHFREALGDEHKKEFDNYVKRKNTLIPAKGSDLEKWMSVGYTNVPNNILYSKDVGVHAKMIYILLLSRLFQKDYCFPGQQGLAEVIQCSLSTIEKSIKELKLKNWVEIKRRGQGQTNIYYMKKA